MKKWLRQPTPQKHKVKKRRNHEDLKKATLSPGLKLGHYRTLFEII
jgi:hypothetical protein